MRKSIFIGALALPLFGASCFNLQESVTEKIAEQATEKIIQGATGTKDVEINGEEVSIVGNGGATINIGSNKLPEDFPSEVPLFPGAQVQSSFKSGDGSEGVWTVTFTSTDSVGTVNNFFKTGLTTNGWDTTYSYALDESYGYTAKRQNLSVTVTVSAGDNNGTSLFVSVSKETDQPEE